MAINNKSFCKHYSSEQGNGTVIALVILVIAALIGVMAFMSGKTDAPNNTEVNTVSSENTEVKEDPNPVLAIIDNEEIKRQDILELLNAMPEQMRQIPLEQLFPMALEQLINNKVVSKKASNAGLDNNEFVKEQLKQAKEQIIRTKFLEDAVKAEISDERLKAEYEEYVANFEEVEEVKVAHILVDDEKLAKNLIAKLKKGDDFAALALDNSTDGSAQNGGDLGYFTKKEVVPEFAAAAFSIKVGEYTKSPVKSDFGYHIIKVDDKRNRPAAKFEQAKPYLEKKLQRVVLEELLKKWRDSIDIERFDINGKPIAEADKSPVIETEAKTEVNDSSNDNPDSTAVIIDEVQKSE